MSITVYLYQNTSDNRTIYKHPSLLTETAITCDVYDPTDRIDPILTIDRDLVNFKTLNYMYIEEFGKYYFITNIEGVAGNKAIIYGHVDVLMSYQSEIVKAKMIAARSTNQYNWYLDDPLRVFSSRVKEQYIKIGELSQPHDLILITVGGTSPEPEENE